MKKRAKSKKEKIDNSQASAAANQDIAGLLETLVQKLTSFETKIDTVLSRIPSQPVAQPRQQLIPAPLNQLPKKPRPMYKIICADCRRSSEVPFKPSGNRPVYCKECFSKRRSANAYRPQPDNRAKEETKASALAPAQPKPEKPTKQPVKKKKTAAKKKSTTKKKAKRK